MRFLFKITGGFETHYVSATCKQEALSLCAEGLGVELSELMEDDPVVVDVIGPIPVKVLMNDDLPRYKDVPKGGRVYVEATAQEWAEHMTGLVSSTVY